MMSALILPPKLQSGYNTIGVLFVFFNAIAIFTLNKVLQLHLLCSKSVLKSAVVNL